MILLASIFCKFWQKVRSTFIFPRNKQNILHLSFITVLMMRSFTEGKVISGIDFIDDITWNFYTILVFSFQVVLAILAEKYRTNVIIFSRMCMSSVQCRMLQRCHDKRDKDDNANDKQNITLFSFSQLLAFAYEKISSASDHYKRDDSDEDQRYRHIDYLNYIKIKESIKKNWTMKYLLRVEYINGAWR